jgi:hypothetical protein
MGLRAFGLLARGRTTPELLVEGELLTGTRVIELSVWLAKHQFVHWVDRVPGPNALVETGPGAEGKPALSRRAGLDHAS